jgi:hypothetical protein
MYYSKILKDSPVGFWKLDETSGDVAYDFSGCGNNGSYVGSINSVQVPLVPGGIHTNKITNTQTISFPITKDFSGQTGIGGFGIEKTEDNDFSLELWFHPKMITSLTPILADQDGIGIYWDKGNIVFKLESERIDYCTNYQNKSFHVVATYEPGVIKLYVDAQLVASKNINPIEFTNESLIIKSGPCNMGEFFLIDAPAIYRYALNIDQIKTHYQHVPANISQQIVQSNFGQLFKSTLQHQFPPDSFTWPALIPFNIFENDNIAYKRSKNSLYLNGASGSYFITSIAPLPHKQYVSSKIEWFATSGIRVYSTLNYNIESPEETVWDMCTNTFPIPGISAKDNFINEKEIYFKIEFNTDNINYYVPELDYLGVYLYENKKIFSHNGRSFLSISEPDQPMDWDVDFSNREYQLLSRNYDNGIRSKEAGFYIETVDNVSVIETILTPSSLTAGYLFFNKTLYNESSLSFDSSGQAFKQNIGQIYINGQDVSAEANIFQYLNLGEPNYIMVKTQSPMTGQIWFNANETRSSSWGNLNLYNLIAIYENDINPEINYHEYIGNEGIQVNNPVITVTDSGSKAYDFDWVLLDNA